MRKIMEFVWDFVETDSLTEIDIVAEKCSMFSLRIPDRMKREIESLNLNGSLNTKILDFIDLGIEVVKSRL